MQFAQHGAASCWALRSQQRFSAAQAAGLVEEEIVAVEVQQRRQTVQFAKDEHKQPETTLADLSALRPAFRKDGTITAGNAPSAWAPCPL